MTVHTLSAFLLFLSQLFAGGGAVCTAAKATMARSATQTVPFYVRDGLHWGATAGEDLIAVSGSGNERSIVRVPRRGAEETLQTFRYKGGPIADALVANGTSWWYSAGAEREGVTGTLFVTGDASGKVTANVVPVDGGAFVSIPLRGDTPRALQIGLSPRERTLVTEVDPSGPQRSWHVPHVPVLGAKIGAERLGDGRIALLVAPNKSGALELILLGKDDRVDRAVLRDKGVFQIATATDGGRLVVAAASIGPSAAVPELLEAAVVDVDRPSAAVWRTLTTTAHFSAFAGELRVVPSARGSVVAWIDRTTSRRLTLQACNFSAEVNEPLVADVGEPMDAGGTSFFSVQRDGGELVFLWDDGRHVVSRRVPADLGPFAAAERLVPKICR